MGNNCREWQKTAGFSATPVHRGVTSEKRARSLKNKKKTRNRKTRSSAPVPQKGRPGRCGGEKNRESASWLGVKKNTISHILGGGAIQNAKNRISPITRERTRKDSFLQRTRRGTPPIARNSKRTHLIENWLSAGRHQRKRDR